MLNILKFHFKVIGYKMLIILLFAVCASFIILIIPIFKPYFLYSGASLFNFWPLWGLVTTVLL